MSELAAEREASPYAVCRRCDRVKCNSTPGECEDDAKVSEGDRKYHLMLEGED
jgi:hypothetical protein